ncbi:MAG: ribosomal protein L16, partial [Candidatus Omnitrophica bacterium]|nr:ribosomal protein L16 [Candidatus Omnitrophota bacterium]
MLLMPRRVKHRKTQKGKNRGVATKGERLIFGEYGLKVLENGLIRANHMD